MFYSKNRQKKGFVLLYALLVTTMATAIGIMAANIATRQLSLSLISRDSHKAFYVADTAHRCASIIAAISDFGDYDYVHCGVDEVLNVEQGEEDGLYNFLFDFQGFSDYGHLSCAQLEIENGKITSDGFSYAKNSNTNCPPEDSARMVWRRRFTPSP